MTSRNKQILVAIIGAILLVGLGVASLIVIPRLTQTDQPIAPTAPESEPAAANDWIGSNACNVSFSVAEPSPTATPSATPTLSGTPTVSVSPTATNTPTTTLTSTPTATPTTSATC